MLRGVLVEMAFVVVVELCGIIIVCMCECGVPFVCCGVRPARPRMTEEGVVAAMLEGSRVSKGSW